jgi:hypothetical protein
VPTTKFIVQSVHLKLFANPEFTAVVEDSAEEQLLGEGDDLSGSYGSAEAEPVQNAIELRVSQQPC